MTELFFNSTAQQNNIFEAANFAVIKEAKLNCMSAATPLWIWRLKSHLKLYLKEEDFNVTVSLGAHKYPSSEKNNNIAEQMNIAKINN